MNDWVSETEKELWLHERFNRWIRHGILVASATVLLVACLSGLVINVIAALF